MNIEWSKYIEEVVLCLREGRSTQHIAKHLNELYGLDLTKNNIISAMCSKEQDRRRIQDGPILRLLRRKYPSETEALIKRYRGKRGEVRGDGEESTPKPVPKWKRKLSPAQLAAFEELNAEPGALCAIRCPHLVLDPRTNEEVPCGTWTRFSHCVLHRAEGKRWIVEELTNRVRRVA